MKHKKTFGIFALAIVAMLGIGMVSAFGFGDHFMKQKLSDEDRSDMQAHMEAMRTAIENQDFESWKALMEEEIAKMQEQITEENFNQIVEQNQEMQQKMQECEENDTCPPPMHEGFGKDMGKGPMPMKGESSSTESSE